MKKSASCFLVANYSKVIDFDLQICISRDKTILATSVYGTTASFAQEYYLVFYSDAF